jgi:two-component system, OmpR family, sensor histidine kinase BaeS
MLSRLRLGTIMAVTLIVAVLLAVGLATLFVNHGLGGRVNSFAHARLERQALHVAADAGQEYTGRPGWTPTAAAEVITESRLVELNVTLRDVRGRTVASSGTHSPDNPAARVVVPIKSHGHRVGSLAAAPAGGSVITATDRQLAASLNRLYVLAAISAAVIAIVLGCGIAAVVARPLRRLRTAAERLQSGELDVAIPAGGPIELQDLGHALDALRRTLKRQENARREIAADLAHELRTPVATLLGRIEALQDGVLPPDNHNLETMRTDTLRLKRLADDIDQLAEADKAAFFLQHTRVDLSAIARAQTDAATLAFQAAGISLSADLRPAPVIGDPDRLAQICANLLTNARSYTPAGGSVAVGVRAERTQALLTLADTGIGIAPEDLPRIFERFWRADRSRSRATGGAGIGLAIVRALVSAHGGFIQTRSELGHGTTITIRIPLAAHASPVDTQRLPTDPPDRA